MIIPTPNLLYINPKATPNSFKGALKKPLERSPAYRATPDRSRSRISGSTAETTKTRRRHPYPGIGVSGWALMLEDEMEKWWYGPYTIHIHIGVI